MDNQIGQFIKKYRKSTRKTQVDLANDLAVSANYISLIENSRKIPGKAFINSFSIKYNIPSVLLDKSTIIPRGKNKAERAIEKKLSNFIDEIEKLVLMRLEDERSAKNKN